jgi:hypothetical protein
MWESLGYFLREQEDPPWLVEDALAMGCVHLLYAENMALARDAAVRLAAWAAQERIFTAYRCDGVNRPFIVQLFDSIGIYDREAYPERDEDRDPNHVFEHLYLFNGGRPYEFYREAKSRKHTKRLVIIDDWAAYDTNNGSASVPGLREDQATARGLRLLQDQAKEEAVAIVLVHAGGYPDWEELAVRGALDGEIQVNSTDSVRASFQSNPFVDFSSCFVPERTFLPEMLRDESLDYVVISGT